MASKLQKYSVDLINIQRKINVLKDTSIEDKDLMELAELRSKYILWLGEIREEKQFEKFDSLHANEFVISDHINNGGVGTIDRYFEVKELLQKEIILRLDFLSRVELVSIPTNKMTIVIDKIKGIYEKDNKEKVYPIESKSQRKIILDLLLNKENFIVYLDDFISCLNKKITSSFLNKEINEINKNFTNNLDIQYDLISKVPTGGYCLNREQFDFISS